MKTLKDEVIPILGDQDVSRVRQVVRTWSVELGFSLVEQTKLVTATSELARNIMVHGGGSGSVKLEALDDSARRGLRITFEDQGPGIPDIDRAVQDGFTTGGGLGLGLGGAKRLVNDFHIASKVGEGTRISIARWK